MSQRAHRSVVAIIASLLIISCLPLAVALIDCPPGWSWTGILSRNTADYNGYLSIIEEIREGKWRTRNLFTAEPHPPFQVRPSFLILGILGRLLPFVSNIFLMEAGRLIAALIFLLLIYSLVKTLFDLPWQRSVAFLVITVGSGLGWLHLTYDPPDLRIIETSTFLALISPPLYCVSLSLFTGILLLLDRAWSIDTAALRPAFLAALLALWQGLDRPFNLAPLFAALLLSTLVFIVRYRNAGKYLKPTAIIAAGAAIAIVYQTYIIRSIPVYSEWNRQHILPTPPALRMLLACGLMLPLAAIGFRPFLQRKPHLGLLAVFYLITSTVFSRTPFPFQERFVEGLPLCLALPASFGLVLLLEKTGSKTLRIAVTCLAILLLIPSDFVSLYRDYRALSRKTPPQYLPDDMLNGMRAIKNFSHPNQAVLSAQSSGNFIPAYSGRPVVLGHQVQTANFAAKRELVTQFFQSKAIDPHSLDIIRQTGASWLFWGPEERWLSREGFNPKESIFLKQKYSNRLVVLYQIMP